jgi:urease accessory protein
MLDSLLVLRLLQDGDSYFPSGSVSFSWGVETLCADGIIRSEKDVEQFVRGQVAQRWLQFDRPIVLAAAQSCAMAGVVAIDQVVEIRTLAAELRSGSRRCGNGLLAVHARLNTDGAREYQAKVQNGEGMGHLAVMQGFLWSKKGIPPREAMLMSAHCLCMGLLGASVRLGVIGHVGAQRILKVMHHDIVEMSEIPPVELEQIHSFVPQTEIASMRHETAQARSFAN